MTTNTKKRRLSAAGRRAISQAAKQRWAAYRNGLTPRRKETPQLIRDLVKEVLREALGLQQ